MANFNPLGYTGNITGSTTRLGVVQFDPVDFSVDEDGVVHLGGTGAVQTINNLLPTAGNITIAGTAAQVSVASAGSTITLSLPAAITAPGSLTTTTTLAAGTTVTAGTDLISTAGNVLIQGAAKQLRVEGGAVTDFIGQATLVAGTVTVANTNIAATDRVFVTRSNASTSTALGVLDVSISAGASFTIDARNPTDATVQTNDVSVVDYFIVRQL